MDKELLEKTIAKLRGGVEVQGIKLYCSEPEQGRFAEEVNLELFVSKEHEDKHLLYSKIFTGRAYYRDWIEIFGIAKELTGVPYFGSQVESLVLDLFSPLTGRIFVEYFDDMETVRELSSGVPPALSRLGFELAKRGFSWFKDWYFPEGLMEGGHKLQAEKAVDSLHMARHVEKLKEELESFLLKTKDDKLKETVLKRFKILEDSWKQTLS